MKLKWSLYLSWLESESEFWDFEWGLGSAWDLGFAPKRHPFIGKWTNLTDPAPGRRNSESLELPFFLDIDGRREALYMYNNCGVVRDVPELRL